MGSGTDHASIATEVKVTNALKEEGIDKHELEERASLKEHGNGRKNTVELSQAS